MCWVRTAVVMALVIAACGDTSGVVSTTGPQEMPETEFAGSPLEDLAAARQRWAAAGLDSYQFEFEDDCGECDPTLRLPRDVVVWEGESSAPQQPTVDDLFTQVELAIRDGRSVDVTYHPELGHPTEIAIDMETRAFDGGTHWLVRDLTPTESVLNRP